MTTIAAPRGDARTFLVHLVGNGLDGDDRFVIEKFKARANGDIVPVRDDQPGPKGRRKAGRTIVSRKAVETMQPARDEIIIATSVNRSGGMQAWGSWATGQFTDRRQRS